MKGKQKASNAPIKTSAEVNFSIQPDNVLSTPALSDDINITDQKMQALAHIVEQGKSIAVHTAYQETPQPDRDPVEIARSNMKPYEKEQYDAWSDGFQLPPFDWKNNVKEFPPGTKSSKRFAAKAEAMNVIWKTNKATPQHAAWVVSELPAILPLINAVGRVEAAKRNLSGGIKELNAMELAELQTIHKVLSTASRNADRYLRETRAAINNINRLKAVLQSRASNIKNKLENSKPREPRDLNINNNNTATITTITTMSAEDSSRDTDNSPDKDDLPPKSLHNITDLGKLGGLQMPSLSTSKSEHSTSARTTPDSTTQLQQSEIKDIVSKGKKREMENQQAGKDAKIKLSEPEGATTSTNDSKKDSTTSSDDSSTDDSDSDDSDSDDTSSDDSSSGDTSSEDTSSDDGTSSDNTDSGKTSSDDSDGDSGDSSDSSSSEDDSSGGENKV